MFYQTPRNTRQQTCLPSRFAQRRPPSQVEAETRWCMRHVPLYQAYYRFKLYWAGSDGIHHALFPGPENDGFRRALERQIQVRKVPSWPRSWANFSLLPLYSHRNAWASLHLLGQPNTFLAPAAGGRRRGAAREGRALELTFRTAVDLARKCCH
jgi:hypothetical protein